MRGDLLRYLCCPECRSPLSLTGASSAADGEIDAGTLNCQKCEGVYPIEHGIPILLPKRVSNAPECALRRDVAVAGGQRPSNWRALYDRHHFRELAHSRLEQALDRRKSAEPLTALDVGIGWGCVWLPFVNRVNLFGLDFSFESLVLLQRIFECEGVPKPHLICGSLSAIPLAGVQFDLVCATQVYQHIPDPREIRASFDTILGSLLKPGGTLFVDNLNYHYFRFVLSLKRLLRGRQAVPAGREQTFGKLSMKYYGREDFIELMQPYPCSFLSWRVAFTETLMHPEFGIRPHSRLASRLDRALSRTPAARFVARQITLEARKL